MSSNRRMFSSFFWKPYLRVYNHKTSREDKYIPISNSILHKEISFVCKNSSFHNKLLKSQYIKNTINVGFRYIQTFSHKKNRPHYQRFTLLFTTTNFLYIYWDTSFFLCIFASFITNNNKIKVCLNILLLSFYCY